MLCAFAVGCGVLAPMPDLVHPALSLDWARPLYELEPFPYHPRELGGAQYVKGPMTPPEGLVVVPSKDRRVRGFEARTGAVLWETRTLGPNVSTPVVVEDDLLVTSLDGHVYRMQQRNGRVVWDSGVVGKGALYGEPAVAGDRVFVTGDDDRLTALALADGRRLWERERAPMLSTSVVARITGQAGAAVAEGRVFTGFSDGRLVAFDVVDGATIWTRDLSGGATAFADVDSTPIVTGDGLIIAAGYHTGLHGVDAATGLVAWRVDGEGFGDGVLHEDTVYVTRSRHRSGGAAPVGRGQGSVAAIDASSGAVSWILKVGEDSPRRPAISAKYVLVPVNSALLVVDRGSGRVIHRYDDRHGFSATPSVAWGTVYAQANSGIMYAFGLY